MKKYAIVNKKTREFYADPIYTDRAKAEAKIEYLRQYEIEHGMEREEYVVEELTKEREEQHQKEWRKFLSALD